MIAGGTPVFSSIWMNASLVRWSSFLPRSPETKLLMITSTARQFGRSDGADYKILTSGHRCVLNGPLALPFAINTQNRTTNPYINKFRNNIIPHIQLFTKIWLTPQLSSACVSFRSPTLRSVQIWESTYSPSHPRLQNSLIRTYSTK